VRAGFLRRVRATSRGVTVAPMPAGHRLLALSDVPDRQRRDGLHELVVGCKHPVIPVPVLARRRHEIGEPVEKLKRCELDDAIGPRPRGLAAATGSEPVGRLRFLLRHVHVVCAHLSDGGRQAVIVQSYAGPED